MKNICLSLLVLSWIAAAPAWGQKPVANKPPTITLTAPANGATYNPPATIVISASAADSDGSIANVKFYEGANLLTTISAPPYSYTWSNVPGGGYSISAKATDNAGAVTATPQVAVNVAPPAISQLSPAEGSSVGTGSVTVSGAFQASFGSVVYIDNGDSTRQATISGNAFSADMPVFMGENVYTISVSHRDKRADVATLRVNGIMSPTATLTIANAAALEAPATVQLSASAFSPNGAISRLDFTRNGAPLVTLSAPPYAYQWTGAPAGTWTLGVTATDVTGASASDSKAVTIAAANQAPLVSISSPYQGAEFNAPANLVLTANASDPDGSVQTVEWFANGVPLATLATAPYTFNWTSVASGEYSVSARATDVRGGVTVANPVTVHIRTANQAPVVSLVSPGRDASLPSSAPVTLSATASDSDGSIASVEFYAGTTLLGSDSTAPYSVAWTNPAPGNHVLTAKATDALGLAANSAPVPVTVTLDTASVIFNGMGTGSTTVSPATILLTASASASSGASITKVEYFEGAQLLSSATSEPFSATWANVGAGTYQVHAKVTDSRGLTAVSPPKAITVTAAPLSATVSAPANGSAAVAGSTVLVTVNALTETSTIATIKLFDGTTQLTSFSPPSPFNSYTLQYNWTPSGTGDHTLSAQVTDAAGATASSAPVLVKVSAPPTAPGAGIVAKLAVAGGYHVERGYIDLFAEADTAAGASVTKVEFLQGASVIASLSAPPFNTTWVGAPLGMHALSVRVTDSTGASMQSDPVNVTVAAAPGVALAPGLEGSTVDGDRMVVRGTVQAPPNSAIDVAGRLGSIGADGSFTIRDVPLAPGATTLTLRVRTIDDHTATTTFNVTSTGAAELRLVPGTSSGLDTVTTRFTLSGIDAAVAARYELRCASGTEGISVTSLTGLAGIQCTYSTPGTAAATVRLYDASSALLQTVSAEVEVISSRTAGMAARSALTGLLARLKDGNAALALKSMAPEAREQYQAIFASLGTGLPVAADKFGTIVRTNFSAYTGEVVVVRGTPGNETSFLINLLLCDDGIWRVVSM